MQTHQRPRPQQRVILYLLDFPYLTENNSCLRLWIQDQSLGWSHMEEESGRRDGHEDGPMLS